MGLCCSKNISVKDDTVLDANAANPNSEQTTASTSTNEVVNVSSKKTPHRTFSTSPCPSPFNGGSSPLPPGILPSPAKTPRRMLRWPFPPPSPAKPIMSLIMRRQAEKAKEGTIREHGETGRPLDKSFGYGKHFTSKYELGKEVGRGHFGHTCWAKVKKGELKGQTVAAKIISKAKMTTAISIEDVRREVKLLKALAGHENLIRFCDVCEDDSSVFLIMELCEGGELLNRILSKGGRYPESDTKGIIVQILNVVAFCHLQGVVHRDLKPENFLFSTKDEGAPLKLIDFGLSDFVRPDQRLNDIVGSAYYVAPEVLHRSYSVEADMWSIGVITYILLCGSRPFWARTESGIFRSVLRADPNFNDSPWPTVSSEATDFVKRLLNKDNRRRMTASQALHHPWLRNENWPVPLDILVYKLVKAYLHATPLKRAALKALSKALPEDQRLYLKIQFSLLEPKHGFISLENFRAALMRNATDAMRESRVSDILKAMAPLSYQKMDFEEFCGAATSVHQLEALEEWEAIVSKAFQFFEIEGNIVITLEKLAQNMNVGPAAYSLLNGCIRSTDKKLSLVGYVKFLHGVSIRSSNFRHRS